MNRRLPKRGFHHAARHPIAGVNLDVLDKAYEDGDEVSAQTLFERNLTKIASGGIKVLGRGEVTKKLTLKVEKISASAREKIEGAGGTVEIIVPPEARAKKNRSKGKAKKGK